MFKRIFYGMGGLSYSVISQTVANFFMFFATSVLGINGTLVGVAVAISTLWDGISDTLIGYLSDNKPLGKLGHRNGYMLIASLGMSIFNIVLWCIPNQLNITLKFFWILISLLFLETFNTMFSTPYMALGTEIAQNYNDRTKINASSTIFFLIGIIIPSMLLIVFFPNTEEYPIGQLNPKGYWGLAIVTSLICLFFGILSSIFTIRYSKILKTKKTKKNNIFADFLSAFKDKKISKIIYGYIFTSISTVFLCSVGLHFFTYSFFYNSKQITFLLLSLMLGNIISQPIWVSLSKKKKKKPALILGIILTIISIFLIMFIYFFRIELFKISYYLMLISVLICGMGSGSLYTLPNSIFGDAIIQDKSNMIATYSGVLTFAGNIANSITQLFVGIMLDVIRFDSSNQIQTLAVQTGLALILFVGVQISLILACFIFSSYKEKGERI